jgi:hypothetical protein
MRTHVHRQAARALDDEDEVAIQFGDGAEGIGRGQRGNRLRIARRKKVSAAGHGNLYRKWLQLGSIVRGLLICIEERV